MKVKVLSPLKYNTGLHQTGEVIEMNEYDMVGLEGVVEKVDEDAVAAENKPSLDWTKKQLVEYATRLGISEPDSLNKKELLAEIEAAEATTGEGGSETSDENSSKEAAPNDEGASEEGNTDNG